MKKLTESDIVRMMREEWNAKLTKLSEDVDVTLKGKVDGKPKTLISPQLKLRHKESRFLYTVTSVSPQEVILKSADGVPFKVDVDTLEKEYALD